MSRPPEIGGFGAQRSEGNCLPDRYLRSSGREARQGPRQGELPASLAASLIGSL